MSRSIDERVADILQSIDRCQRYLDALESGDTDLVDMAEDAVERNLQIIGEAANHLPPEITVAHPEIAWPQIRGFRNILVHHYFGVDVATGRDVIQIHLPALATALRGHIRHD
ncbi:HepT-like ribonuclease domain-containing protein [Leucobacter sp. W1038]|uniref:HepT-like ribonuclease domain-containing protein n=1 Tax=Leucobacter sp. W1038 TaxID=3438281 RepID=UPI003D95F51F